MPSWIITLIVFIFSALTILATSIMQMIYGAKINSNEMTEEDRGAGIFFITMGVISALFAMFIGYVCYSIRDKVPMYVLLIVGLYALFILASGTVQIIYGNKIHKNTIDENDEHAGRFLISVGSINVVLLMLIVSVLIYLYNFVAIVKELVNARLLLP